MASLLATDILLHRGMSRVMLPDHFEEGILPQRTKPCRAEFFSASKNWFRGINDTALLINIPADAAGIEFDAYWDQNRKDILLFHDSGHYQTLAAATMLQLANSNKKSWSYWFDLKNVSEANAGQVLQKLVRLRDSFGLNGRILVETSDAGLIQPFCDSGFFTSYYIPFFNPYEMSKDSLSDTISYIAGQVIKNQPSALSGYYFQYPVLKKAFPDMPLLTWVDDASFSVVGYFFRRTLENDQQLKIVLQPTPVK